MTLRGGYSALHARVRHPRTTVRWRLTLLYGAVFLVSGAVLLAITYTLVAHATVNIGPKGVPTYLRSEQLTNGKFPQLPDPSGNQNFVRAPPSPALLGRVKSLLGSQAGQIAVRIVGDKQRILDLNQLEVESVIALAIMAVISAALGWVMAGRVLRPLRTMTAATQQISEANLHQRLAVHGPRDELTQLADTIDGLLGRLERAFAAQRRFVANASHELRTPLTAVRALLEMVLSDPRATIATFRTTCQQVLEESAQQEQLIDALLALAHGQRGIEARETTDLATIVADVLKALGAETDARGLELDVALQPAPLSGDRRLIARLASNLVDNALRHNRPGGRVLVRVTSEDGQATLTIANTGPFVPASEVERLLQPFQRLAADRVGYGDGLGLGLSIVAAIVEAHDAALDVQPGREGGLEVAVRFPRAPKAAPPVLPERTGDTAVLVT